MKRTLIPIIAICALLVGAVLAFGDIAKPKPTPGNAPRVVLYTGLTIVSDTKNSEARLQIPEKTLKLLQSLTNGDSSSSLTDKVMHSSTRTMMAGLFMFLAVSFGGVWLARSGQRRNQKTFVAVLLAAFVLGVGTMIVRANAGPPGYIRWQNLPQALKDGKETDGGVEIEIVPGSDNMKLIVPLRQRS